MPIRVELELEDGSFTSRMIHAGESVEQFRRNVGQGVVSMERLNDKATTFSGTMRDMAITVGLASMAIGAVHGVTESWVGSIIKVNAEMERLKFLLAGMSKAADPMKEAAQQVMYLRDFAKDAPFSLKALSDTFVKLKSTGIDPMGGALKGLVDGIAAFGGTDETLHRASIAIQQMSGKGVIQMEELRQQLGEAMPRAVELMARSMGISTAELIQTVSKGTLDAKSSLASFTMELDRTFGGAAANQMNTFNGMVSKTTTLFQTLALQAGDAGFFETIKDKMRQFNELLGSKQFAEFATSMGQWGASFVNAISGAITTLVSFREEIKTVGIVLATAFGVSKLAQLATSFSGTIAAMRTAMSAFRVDVANFGRDTAAAFRGFGSGFGNIGAVAQFATATGTITNAAGVWSSRADLMRGSWQALTTTVAGSATAIRALLPVLGAMFAFVAEFALPLTAMGAALYLVYEALTKESRAAQEAYDSMVKFGAQTEEQITLSEKHVAILHERAAALEALSKAANSHATFSDYGMQDSFAASAYGVDGSSAQKAKDEAAKADKDLADGKAKFEAQRGERFAQLQTRLEQEQQARRKAGYDKEAIAAAQAHDTEMENLKKTNKDTSAEKERYLEESRQRQLASYQLEYSDAEAQLQKIKELAASGDKDAIAGQETAAQKLTSTMRKAQDEMTRLKDMALGPQSNKKDTDVDKLMEKARSKLDTAKADIAAQRAELQGLSGEYARLAYMIEEADSKANGMFTFNNPGLQKLIQDLKDTQAEADKVTEALNAMKAFDSDLASANAGVREEYAKQLNNGKGSVFDSIVGKGDAGMYSGKSAIARMLGGVKIAAEETGKAMGDSFGSLITDKINTVTQALGLNAKAWAGVRDNAAGIVPQGSAPGAYGGDMSSGGSDYASRVIKTESSGNPNAKSDKSTAAGLGGFTKGTWMDFIKEKHPELTDLGEPALLGLRSQPGLANQAVDWYGGKNAATLKKNGFEATDANTYLAHFLGAGGAMSVLRASPSTPLDQIKSLDEARAKNPEVFGRAVTAGGLQSWAKVQQGGGTSEFGDGSSYSRTRGMATNDQERAKIDETHLLEGLTKQMKGANDLGKVAQDMKEAVAAAKENEDGSSKYRNGLTKMIRAGKAFPDKLDPSSPEYGDMFKLADQTDASLREAAEAKKRNERLKQIREAMPADSDALDEKSAEALKRLQSGGKFRLSDGFYSQERKANKNVQALVEGGDADPSSRGANAATIAQLQSNTDKQRNLEVTNALNAENQKYEGIKQSLMNTDQARREAYEKEVERLRQLLEVDTSTGKERESKEEEVERRISLLRQQQFQLTPLGGMLKQWGDYGHNLEQAATGWMNGFNDKLADMVMHGRVSFRSLALSIEKDILTMSMKAAESKLFSSVLGGTGLFGGGGGAATGGLDGLAAIHHTGGVAGSAMPSRRVNMNMFAGANRWHTGTGGMTLGGDEIPIIAKRGEQVDWPANLARQYGGKGGGFAMGDINVQGASDGSPTQNRDLAEQIAGHVKAAASQMVGQELRTQMRPGGTIRAMSGK